MRPEPLDFLAPVRRLWDDPRWVERMALLGIDEDGGFPTSSLSPVLQKELGLRVGQSAAFNLLRHAVGLLWGPPGSGKTTTAGAMIANFLTHRTVTRVLLLAPTNLAVDHALLAVDKALSVLGARGNELRKGARRIGRAGDPQLFKAFPHLLKASRVDTGGRQALREAWTEAPLLAMTTARALLEIERLRHGRFFDLLVIDEGSQVPLPTALALAPLAVQVICAGDPAQMGPVVRAEDEQVRTWMGRSLFDWERSGGAPIPMMLLDEQSRMAVSICEMVGRAFYNGQLHVCAKAARDPEWTSWRTLFGDKPWRAFAVENVADNARYSGSRGGLVREASALAICREIQQLLALVAVRDILVLTPYHAQVRLIRETLRSAGLPRVKVTTVHRAQGGECRVVLFDPVDGHSLLLRGTEGKRLVNVAMSRAQARLVLFLSPSDRSATAFAFLSPKGAYSSPTTDGN